MLDVQELERYARHIVLREVGGPGQAKLKASRVLVIGAGGLGAPVLLFLRPLASARSAWSMTTRCRCRICRGK